MANGSAHGNIHSNARATDPFWDKVIQATETVVAYPGQRINVTVKDRQAQIGFDSEQDVLTVTMTLIRDSGSQTEGETDA